MYVCAYVSRYKGCGRIWVEEPHEVSLTEDGPCPIPNMISRTWDIITHSTSAARINILYLCRSHPSEFLPRFAVMRPSGICSLAPDPPAGPQRQTHFHQLSGLSLIYIHLHHEGVHLHQQPPRMEYVRMPVQRLQSLKHRVVLAWTEIHDLVGGVEGGASPQASLRLRVVVTDGQLEFMPANWRNIGSKCRQSKNTFSIPTLERETFNYETKKLGIELVLILEMP